MIGGNRPRLPIGLPTLPPATRQGGGAGYVAVSSNVKQTYSGSRDAIVSRTTTAADSAPVSATVTFPATANLLEIEFAVAGTVAFLAIVLPDGTQIAKICVPNQATPSVIAGDVMSLLQGITQANYSTQLFGAGSLIADFHYVKVSNS